MNPFAPEALAARYPGWHAHCEVLSNPRRGYNGVIKVTLSTQRVCNRCGRHHQVQGAVIDDRGVAPLFAGLDYAVNAIEGFSH